MESATPVEVGTWPNLPANIDPDTLNNYDLPLAQIAKLSKDYLPLTIAGVEDKEGYKAVHDARMTVKAVRVGVEKRRKELKEGVLEEGRKIDLVAGFLSGELEAIESQLGAKETEIDQLKAAAAEEKRKAAQATLQARVDALAKVGGSSVDLHTLGKWTDGQFDTFLADKTQAWEVSEKARLDAEAALEAQREAQAVEAERQAAAKAELDRQAADLKARQDEIDRKEREAAQKEREERIAKEAADKARLDAEVKAAQDKAEADRKARLAKEQAEREAEEARERAAAIEAARPDSAKLAHFANLLAGVTRPDLTTEAGRLALSSAQTALDILCDDIRHSASYLVQVQPTTKAASTAAPKGVHL